MSQLALPLAWGPEPGKDEFLVGPSNEAAVKALDGWAAWPVRTGLLVGPRKSGRSLLARVWAGRSGGLVIDGADGVPEESLFHAWNRAQAANRPLLLIADARPPAWEVSLPDLRSRLAASPSAEIDAPDDALVRALLERGLARRGLDARPDLVDWIAARIERSHVAVVRAVDALDTGAMERRRGLSIPFARETLGRVGLIAAPATNEER